MTFPLAFFVAAIVILIGGAVTGLVIFGVACLCDVMKSPLPMILLVIAMLFFAAYNMASNVIPDHKPPTRQLSASDIHP